MVCLTWTESLLNTEGPTSSLEMTAESQVHLGSAAVAPPAWRLISGPGPHPSEGQTAHIGTRVCRCLDSKAILLPFLIGSLQHCWLYTCNCNVLVCLKVGTCFVASRKSFRLFKHKLYCKRASYLSISVIGFC